MVAEPFSAEQIALLREVVAEMMYEVETSTKADRIKEARSKVIQEAKIESAAIRERNDLRRQLSEIRKAFEPLHRALYPDSWHK